MAKNNSTNTDITNNADGWDLTGGSTNRRKLTVTGADITVTGSGSNTYTFPAATDTLVARTSTDTLTNKTLTAAKISSASYLADTNGNELIKFPSTVASAVNEITVTNAATGSDVDLSATGGDTDIGLRLNAKGSEVTKIKVLRQDDTSNTYTSNTAFLTGWGFINGDGSSKTLTESVTFGITFSQIPIVVEGFGGAVLTANTHDTLDDFTSAGGASGQRSASCAAISTTGFTAAVSDAATLSNVISYAYTWIAVGQFN